MDNKIITSEDSIIFNGNIKGAGDTISNNNINTLYSTVGSSIQPQTILNGDILIASQLSNNTQSIDDIIKLVDTYNKKLDYLINLLESNNIIEVDCINKYIDSLKIAEKLQD